MLGTATPMMTTVASGDGHVLSSWRWRHLSLAGSAHTEAIDSPLSEQVLEGLESTPTGWYGQRAHGNSGKPNSAAKASAAVTRSPIFLYKETKAFRIPIRNRSLRE